MKKLLLSIFAIILCVPALVLAGCGTQPNYINMSTYFKTEVKYQAYNQSEQKTQLANLTSKNNSSLNKYTSITIEGNNDWLYKMTIETISFEIVSNITDEIEFTVRMTNLKTGNQSGTGSTSIFEKKISPSLIKDESTFVELNINDIINSNSTTTKIEIKVDASYYTGDNADLDFKFAIQNLKVAGQHKR